MLRSLALRLTPAVVLSGNLAAAATLPFEGRWALRAEMCAEAGKPITVTVRRLEAQAMTCDFTSVLPGGISYRVEAACEASGQKGNEFFTFAVLDGRLHWSWAGQTGIFERCPQ